MLKIVDDTDGVPGWPSPPDGSLARLRTGEEIHLDQADGQERVRLTSSRGELIFEYDPVRRVTRLNVPEGDLQLAAPTGGIDLAAAHGVRLSTPRRVEIDGGAGVHLHSGSAAAGDRTAAQLDPGRLTLSGALLELLASRGEVRVDDLRYVGTRLNSALSDARISLDKLDVAAETVTRTATNVYDTVRGLLQSRAGRARTIVEKTFHIKSNKLFAKADQAIKINGEKIYLG